MTEATRRTSPLTRAPGGTVALAGRPVARVGFGVMQLERSAVGKDAALAILRQAAGAGVNHLDTAQFYGACNELIREALAPYDDDLVLATKVGAVRDADAKPLPLIPAQRPDELRAQVEANLAALGTERLGVVNLRRLDAKPGIIAEGEQRVDLDDQLAELNALRDAGKIGGIGLSNVSAAQLRQALPAGIACVQNLYSALDRTAEPVLDLCREHDIAWVPFFPLGSAGFASTLRVTDDPTVAAIAAELGVTPAQVGLAWQLAHYDRTLLIPGTANPAHLAENLAAGDVKLPEASRTAIDHLAGRFPRKGATVSTSTPRQTVERFLKAVVSPTPGDLADCYADQIVIEMPFASGLAPERTETTREEIRQRFAAGAASRRYTGLRDVRVHETADPDILVLEYRLDGTRISDGEQFTMGFVMVLTFRDGLIAHSRDYTDPFAGARALGRRHELTAALKAST